MAVVNRASIRSYARIRADQTNSTFPSDTEYNTLIDSAAKTVWRKLNKAGWKPTRGSTVITANGAFAYTVDSNILSVLSVQRVEGSIRTPLPRVKPEDWESYLSMGAGPALVYELIEGVVGPLKIELYPRPSSGSYEVVYLERYPGMDDDADVWNGPEGSEDLVGLGAAIMALKKEGIPTQELQAEYTELYAEVCESAGLLDAMHPGTVRDTRDLYERDAFDWNASEGWF